MRMGKNEEACKWPFTRGSIFTMKTQSDANKHSHRVHFSLAKISVGAHRFPPPFAWKLEFEGEKRGWCESTFTRGTFFECENLRGWEYPFTWPLELALETLCRLEPTFLSCTCNQILGGEKWGRQKWFEPHLHGMIFLDENQRSCE